MFLFFPVNLEKVPVNWKWRNCPWTLKVPVNVFQKKCPWTYRNCPWTPKICKFWYFFRKKCPWTAKSTREHLPKFCPWTKKKCPWIGPLKCPWTQKSAREQIWQNEVHGHFWCSRGKKKHWWVLSRILCPFQITLNSYFYDVVLYWNLAFSHFQLNSSYETTTRFQKNCQKFARLW